MQQTSTVDEYRTKFEELRAWAIVRNKELNESFFVDCFVGGLREDIRLGIQDIDLTTLAAAIRRARNEEARVKAWIKRSKYV